MLSPCLNCEERKPKCHSECEKYLALRLMCDKRMKERGRQEVIMRYFHVQHEKALRILRRQNKKIGKDC